MQRVLYVCTAVDAPHDMIQAFTYYTFNYLATDKNIKKNNTKTQSYYNPK